jgi:pyrroline-5-carboxylate reductase
METVVFLGGGRITSAIVRGLGLRPTKFRLVVHDHKARNLLAFQKVRGVSTEARLAAAVAQADMLIVAVRPNSVRKVLHAIGQVPRPLLAVSLAAGLPFSVLKRSLGHPVRWARAMPSPLCSNGNGLTALSFSPDVSRADQNRIGELFANLGPILRLPEAKLDAFTVTYSSSHGYHALEILAAAGQWAGLDRKTALLASAHALADSVLAWRNGKRSLKSLLNEASTPGGVAASTMLAMDAVGYRRAVYKGIATGLRRAKANAKS